MSFREGDLDSPGDDTYVPGPDDSIPFQQDVTDLVDQSGGG